MPRPEPFKVDIPDTVLDDLAQRLDNTRWPDTPDEAGWAFGANLDYMKRLAAYWRHEFDWRASEAQINRFPQFTAPIATPNGGPLDIHFIHERGSGTNPLPLLLLHGWPGSIVEFLEIIEPLAHPERFGGDAADGFDVIAPSLPGFGFSDIPPVTIGPQAVAGMMNRLMRDTLGYDRYVAQGGDWGSIIAARIALDHPDGLAALHLNMLPLRPSTGPDDTPLSDDEKTWFTAVKKNMRQETAYQEIQATKPQTLAYGLMDSPIGLAGWITEKFHGWTDPASSEPPFAMDRLLTNIMVYWATGTINSSARIYRGYREERCGALRPGEAITQPTGFCLPPNDLFPPPPSSWVRRLGNVTHETRLDRGGHFTAMEIGMPFVEDVRTFFRKHRSGT